jgi:hypothetical protein
MMANQPPEDISKHQEICKHNAEEFRWVMHKKAAFACCQAVLRLDLLKMAKEMHFPFVLLLTVMDLFNASKRVEFINKMASE